MQYSRPTVHYLSLEVSKYDEVNFRDRPRFFDQVGHQTTNASIENKHLMTLSGLPKL